jgi:hypothetical protein
VLWEALAVVRVVLAVSLHRWQVLTALKPFSNSSRC